MMAAVKKRAAKKKQSLLGNRGEDLFNFVGSTEWIDT